MEKCHVIAVTNQKGGVGKTTTTVNLGVGLARMGKRVLLVDADPQGSLTVSLGVKNPDELPVSIATVMQNTVDDKVMPQDYGIIHHSEGVDLLPSNIELSAFEVGLFNTMSREMVLKNCLDAVKKNYDYWQWDDQRRSAEDFDALAQLVADTPQAPEQTPAPGTELPEEPKNEAEAAYAKYAELYALNNDFVGWIAIDGTNLDYPVMQTVNSPDYYLKHSFEKTYSDYGVPYVDEACAVDQSNNIVIYGHHMKNKTMFSSLVNYANKAYFDEHPVIRFDTLFGFGEYRVIAAFSFDTNNETFRYNEYTDRRPHFRRRLR